MDIFKEKMFQNTDLYALNMHDVYSLKAKIIWTEVMAQMV